MKKSGISSLQKDTTITQGDIDAGKWILRKRLVCAVPIARTA
jgi:hypothetical protein